jgi:hypothetical protein
MTIEAVMMEVEVKIPKTVWNCVDCGTISDEKFSHLHIGHAGQTAKPKMPAFIEMRKPKLLARGEIIWVMKDEQTKS